jgi:hypothetical protein
MTEQEQKICEMHLDGIVRRNGGDDRTRKWVSIRREIIRYFLDREAFQTAQLREQVKELQEQSRQITLF